MATLTEVIFFSLIGGVFSLIGGVLLIARRKHAKLVAEYATPFAAGALLAAAFLDILKEGLELGGESVMRWALAGLLVFFLLESLLTWFGHHHEHEGKRHVDPRASFVIIGDTLHNFIDGAAIAASFLISVPTGIVTTVAVAAHEIPQEIGDFGLLLNKGLRRGQVLLVNVFSALATTVAAIIFFELGADNDGLLSALLGMTAGFFIYIAVSDIIPSIHRSAERRTLNIKSLLLILGVVLVGLTTTLAHNYIETEHSEAGHGHAEAHSR